MLYRKKRFPQLKYLRIPGIDILQTYVLLEHWKHEYMNYKMKGSYQF